MVTGQQGPFVFVIKEDMTAEPRPVVVEQIANGMSVIAKGLASGEKVVTDGQSRLRSGTKVQLKSPVETMAAQPGATS